MASYPIKLTTLYRLLRAQQLRQKGFTLTELLISIVISTIIIGTLLYIVVELLGVNNREESLTQTQQDMRRALDYINTDLSESVYIYADPTAVTNPAAGGLTDLPGTATPVLAFWRIDPVDTSLLGTCGGATEEECASLRVRQFAHTLVVYLQQENSGDDIWEGPRRILRYELDKYSNVANLTQTTGYLDPTNSGETDSNGALIEFENWERGDSTTDGTVAVLTDYVDNPVDSNVTPTCPAGYEISASALDNFYACTQATATITDQVSGEEVEVRENRSVLVYLRGNALADAGVVFGPTSEASRLPILESEVLVRGVIEEQP